MVDEPRLGDRDCLVRSPHQCQSGAAVYRHLNGHGRNGGRNSIQQVECQLRPTGEQHDRRFCGGQLGGDFGPRLYPCIDHHLEGALPVAQPPLEVLRPGGGALGEVER